MIDERMKMMADHDAEQAVLGSGLIDRAALRKAASMLKPIDFYSDKHRAIYVTMIEIDEHGEPPDLVTVTKRLTQAGKLEDVGGSTYIASLPNATPTSANVEAYAQIVREFSVRRQLYQTARSIAVLARDGDGTADSLVEEAAMAIRNLRLQTNREDRPQTVSMLKAAVIDAIDEAGKRKDKTEPLGVPYGLPFLDRMTHGQFEGEMIQISGPTSAGKSVLATQLWDLAGRKRGPALMLSNEMTAREYILRLMARRARVDLNTLRSGNLSDRHWADLSGSLGVLHDADRRLYLLENVWRIEQIRAAIESVFEDAGSCAWVCVDWLQQLQSSAVTRRGDVEEMDMIMRDLSRIAKEYKVPLVFVSQWAKDKRHGIGASRGSLMIDQVSQVIIQIEPMDPKDEGTPKMGPDNLAVRLFLEKNRQGKARISQGMVLRGGFMEYAELAANL